MSIPALKLYHKESYPAISPTLPQLSQKGRTVVVAGSSSGIGFAIARSFVAAGSKQVILLGRRRDAIENAAKKLNQEFGTSIAQGKAADIASLEGVRELWSDFQSEGVYVDVLVLNAAAFGNSVPILENGLQNVWADFETNVRGPLDMTELFFKQTTGRGQKVRQLEPPPMIAPDIKMCSFL